MYIVRNIYEIPDGKKIRKLKVDFDKIWALQVKYNIESDEAVTIYLFDKYHKLFPRLGGEIIDTIYNDYLPYEREMYDMAIYDWM